MNKDLKMILPVLLLSALALLAGLWAALARLGWALPALTPALPMQHGPLMVSGFLGSLIALERVAALRQRWMFSAPILSGLGWILSLALPAQPVGPLLITLGSLATCAILGVIYRREPKIYTGSMLAGTLFWLGGNLLWLWGMPIFRVVWWWAAFLVLTIAGERLELSRVLRLRPAHFRLFGAAALLFAFGVILSPWLELASAWVTGAGMLALAVWLLRYDIARRNLRHPAPLTRFIAVCLFSGYVWLGLGGLLQIIYGPQSAGPYYDAVLHAVLVGFVFSMIFGHAPIILPALTGIQVRFHAGFYTPLTLLHLSLLLRIASDLAGWAAGRMWGGLLNEIAILGFLAFFGYTIISGKRIPASRVVKRPASSSTKPVVPVERT